MISSAAGVVGSRGVVLGMCQTGVNAALHASDTFSLFSSPSSPVPCSLPRGAAAGGEPGDAGDRDVLLTVRISAGPAHYCRRVVLPTWPQVQHPQHPLQYGRCHLPVRARFSAGCQPDRTAGLCASVGSVGGGGRKHVL